ncbi:MAG: ribonuclease III [Acidobacteriaceae bacterium]|nr:ribonuclease III [Acidobacteriaceae bacterium]
MHPPVEALEQKLGYRFRNQELLVRALTHRSWLSEKSSVLPRNADNEQLEFLGDSILGFAVSEALVLRHPTAHEGQLSQWKAHLVSATHLHRCALELGLGDFLLLGRGEEQNGGRGRKTLLANALEALIAAMYIDGGLDIARNFIEQHLLSVLQKPDDVESLGLLNHKSVLQERAQALGLPVPRYSTVETSGPEHAKVFTVEARIGNQLVSRAAGSSKKAASQQAAERLIEQLLFLERREEQP